jgi:adenylosuccinate synthase
MTQAHIVVGLGFGDEGKGAWVDHLVRRHGIKYVVRFNGGAQAAHHVVTPEGVSHCFAQFGSGTLVPGTHTTLSRFMLIDPEAWLREASNIERLGVSTKGVVLMSENAPIITPFNRILNRIQEVARGNSRHGSCGFGIGLTQADVETLGDRALYVRDILSDGLGEKLAWLRERKFQEAQRFSQPGTAALREQILATDLDYYVELFRCFAERVRVVSDDEIATLVRTNDTVFEGAQGVMLDQQYGTFPYCSRSNCTFENADMKLPDLRRTPSVVFRTILTPSLRCWATRFVHIQRALTTVKSTDVLETVYSVLPRHSAWIVWAFPCFKRDPQWNHYNYVAS